PKLRHWNRYYAAILNFRHILFSLRNRKGIPERFQHMNASTSADQPQKSTKHCKKSTKQPTKRRHHSKNIQSSHHYSKPRSRLLNI
ncbi:hypothetical protein COEREDRAFT_47028, partial [Coemansia reversa NRRL 1564]